MKNLARPPYDPQIADGIRRRPAPIPISVETIAAIRADPVVAPISDVIRDRPLEVLDFRVPGYGGGEIGVSVLRRTDHAAVGSAVYFTHGGGMFSGHRWVDGAMLAAWVEEHDSVIATVEYRLAPEYPDPVPVEDCYAGLVWFAEQATTLGFDPARIMVGGGSAGGGLAAGITLLARDRGGPAIAAQLLICPMLDDRNTTVSSLQFSGTGLWDREQNAFGWRALLGDRAGTDDVSIYAAPSRATNLSGLPPTYIDAGSAEVFRDEDVAYASAIWAAGGVADLHIWAGGFHGFETVTDAEVSISARRTREAWVRRILGPTQTQP
jgi:acetyl esterase/lipase